MNDLLQSIPSTNIKIIELYNKIDSENLMLQPDFQRKLVWKKQHKFHFIETILKNYPFPEVYIASAEIDVTSITSKEVVVDGQQRLSTIVDYIKNQGDFETQNKVTSFQGLDIEKKKKFLNYLVSVRDLKDIGEDIIKEIFMRINNTEYSLNTVEKINAQFGDSEFVIFCKQLSEREFQPNIENTTAIVVKDTRDLINDFFLNNKVFTENDMKRMNDLQYVMTLVSTLIESDYFSRNTKVIGFIEQYNSEFDRQSIIEEKLLNAINLYNLLELETSSYWFSRTNVFTLLVVFSNAEIGEYNVQKLKEELLDMEVSNKKYFAGIETDQIPAELHKYFEFGKEAVNEKSARIYRADIIKKVLEKVKA
jgi:hypothetical protein